MTDRAGDGATDWERRAKRVRVPLGFAVAALYVVLARPTGKSLLWSVPLVVAGVLLRGYASGFVRKNAELTTAGPYGFTRNPLYLGSLGLLLGFGVASGSVALSLVLLALFLVVYLPVIRGEERFLRAHFADFDRYAEAVPRLLPRLRRAVAPPGGGTFSAALYRQHREYNAAMGTAAVYGVLLLRLAAALWVKRLM